MSSYLEKQSSAFKGNLASAAAKLSNPSATSTKSAALAPASPVPSAHSENNLTPSAKRKRDAIPDVPYSQPQLTGYGSEVKTQMTFAVEYLKKKGETKSIIDIIDHLSLQGQSEQHKKELAEGLRRHPRVDFQPDRSAGEPGWTKGKYSHRPVIPGVKDGESLLAHLQRKTDASGVSVKDLKDGWADCEDTLQHLEDRHKILVVRTKKDSLPRYVWPNDQSLFHSVQPEFQVMWHRTPLPSLEDMHRKLVGIGQKPTSDDPRDTVNGGGSKAKQQKKRVSKKIGKATNVHMAHLMQDFSGMRR